MYTQTSPALEALLFLINFGLSFFVFFLLLRVLAQFAGISFANPVSQFLIKSTEPGLRSLRHFLPRFRHIDLAAIIAVFVLQFVIACVFCILRYNSYNIILMLSSTIYYVLLLTLNIYLWGILIFVIFSWLLVFGMITNYAILPIFDALRQLIDPVLRPAQQLLPPISGIDLSPMLSIAVLIALKILIFSIPHIII